MENVTTVLKMVVNTVAVHGGPSTPCEEITMSAVYSDKEGSVNKQWSKWTPTGQLKYTVTNENLFGKIRPGDYFMVNLVRCDKDAI